MHSVKLLTIILIGAMTQDATARDITVVFGQSIQAAVDLASPGDRILVQPGTYREPGRYCPTIRAKSAQSSFRRTISASSPSPAQDGR